MTAPALPKLNARLPELAREHGLILVSALPEPDGIAHTLLDPEQLPLEQYLGLARDLRARILYAEAERFDADAFTRTLDTDDADDDDEGAGEEDGGADHMSEEASRLRARVERRARRHHGDLACLGLCFMADAVAHFLMYQPPWHSELEQQRSKLKMQLELDGEEEGRAKEENDQRRTVDLAVKFADLPAFRAATKFNDALEAALAAAPMNPDAPPSEQGRHHHVVMRASRTAYDNVHAQAARISADLEDRLDEVVAHFHAAGGYTHPHSASTRSLDVTDFYIAHTGGYRPSARVLKLLLHHPGMKPAARFPSVGDALFSLT